MNELETTVKIVFNRINSGEQKNEYSNGFEFVLSETKQLIC